MTHTMRLLSLSTIALCAACGDTSNASNTGNGGGSADDGIDLDASSDGADASEGGSADGSDDGSLDLDCGGDTIVADLATPKVMLVLDKSGSMASERWDDDADPHTPDVTRWHSLHRIVADLVHGQAGALELGAALFPAAGADHHGGFDQACRVADAAEVAIATDNGDAILAAMPDADAEVRGGTPTRAGLLNAVEALVAEGDAAPRAMILVTDGAANCVPGADPFNTEYDDELALAVGSAFADNGIPTYVIGIDIRDEIDPKTGRNVHAELAKVANAGGTARAGDVAFYEATSASQLEGALAAVTQRVSCTVQIDQRPADPMRVGLTIDQTSYDRVDSCDGGSGWRWISADTIELCGATCDAFATTGQLETAYACPPVG